MQRESPCSRAYVRETCFETRDTPTGSAQPRYVGDSFSLSFVVGILEYRRQRRAARRRGSRDDVLVVPGVSPPSPLPQESLPCCDMCVRARKFYRPSFSVPSPRISPSLSRSLNVSVKVSGPTHRSRSAVSATTVASHTTEDRSPCIRYCARRYGPRTYTPNEREREKEIE